MPRSTESPNSFARSRSLLFMVTCGVLILAGIACDAGKNPTGDLLAEVIPYTEDWRPDRSIQAAFLMQKSDCDGNLNMLGLMRRDRVQDLIDLRVIWYVGAVEDSSYIRSELPPWASEVPLVPASERLSRAMIQLGHRSSPILVVLDQMSRVRLVTQSPRSPREFAGLRMVIEGMTWIEEL